MILILNILAVSTDLIITHNKKIVYFIKEGLLIECPFSSELSTTPSDQIIFRLY